MSAVALMSRLNSKSPPRLSSVMSLLQLKTDVMDVGNPDTSTGTVPNAPQHFGNDSTRFFTRLRLRHQQSNRDKVKPAHVHSW